MQASWELCDVGMQGWAVMLVPSGPTASVSPFILQNSQDTRLFWNTLKRGPNSLAVHSPLRNLGADLSLPGPLSLGLLPLRPGLTPLSLCSARRTGMGPTLPELLCSLGAAGKDKQRGCPESRQALSYKGPGSNPLRCAPVCFLKAHPPPLLRSVPAWWLSPR